MMPRPYKNETAAWRPLVGRPRLAFPPLHGSTLPYRHPSFLLGCFIANKGATAPAPAPAFFPAAIDMAAQGQSSGTISLLFVLFSRVERFASSNS